MVPYARDMHPELLLRTTAVQAYEEDRARAARWNGSGKHLTILVHNARVLAIGKRCPTDRYLNLLLGDHIVSPCSRNGLSVTCPLLQSRIHEEGSNLLRGRRPCSGGDPLVFWPAGHSTIHSRGALRWPAIAIPGFTWQYKSAHPGPGAA